MLPSNFILSLRRIAAFLVHHSEPSLNEQKGFHPSYTKSMVQHAFSKLIEFQTLTSLFASFFLN
ncbi:hypothetical protein HMPREF0620_0201 [Parascardovia denticolens DSM 10105 = JCM 12538]|uniref:Uncharacterized protein n=1 Tax=Parascardovia denticolens DSM 10105 = JCM 12538 TaxID=864564 RepID=E6JZQ0_PARDN|nr:hypothetical protein HMPREF9017_00245 [Parascardovia denticolens F0305]EFT83196.1 hypothetical protein HMPREF0620_0201 [Parascardovia denticolens DSM 10105 = JCM 12538]BAR05901.1 hypothetical protein PSDT_1382 [Parascardovia denticolens DSM 10105 = JCM 12538]